MKSKIFKALSIMLFLMTMLCVFHQTAFALEWDGSTTGGGGGGYPAGPNGYAVRTTDDNCVGYRFSVVTKSGSTKNDAVIDVFRGHYYGGLAYSSAYKFNSKYNKKQLIDRQNWGFGTSRNSTNCYKEGDMGFAWGMPTPDSMSSWQNNTTNLNAVLYKLGISGIGALKNGDKVLVEPLYDVRLQSIYHSVTPTEIAIYGKYILGSSSNGGGSKTSASWGFIAAYTNKHYPNSLYTPDGQGLWDGVGALSKQATFYTIINTGYGVGIAYTENKPDFTPSLSVRCCEAWPGAKSTRNNHYGVSYGSSFNDYAYGNGYPILGDTVWFALNFPAETQNCYVRQSVWIEGGGSTSRTVWSDSNTWYDVALSPTTVDTGRSSYVVKARVDWIDGSGNVLKWGAEKTFYIPIRPKIHQYQVTMYSVSGAVAAYSGEAGSSGSVYYGQRVYPKYTFSSDNTWTSGNNFGGTMYEWQNNEWKPLWDMQTYKIGINKSNYYHKYSDEYPYLVPDNSANTNGSNRIPVMFASEWVSDPSHTYANKWVDIPIAKADAEITNIRLIDENGFYLDQYDLEAGQKVAVQYTYKNNSTCTIYVNGYNDNKTQIPGIYAIEPGKSINVNGNSFEVPNRRSFYLWGGVYLDGAGIYNTGYETNEWNNTILIVCRVNHPVKLVPIAPNAPYRENTWVISSYWLNNIYHDNYIPDNNISIKFSVYNSDNRLIATTTKTNQIVPGNDKNLVYFKWYVPSGMYGDDVRVEAELIENSKSYNKVSNYRSTIPNVTLSTPDTQFEKSAPVDFTASALPVTEQHYATWWEYRYENGQFKKVDYGIGIYTGGIHKIEPATGSTATQNGSEWTMKSGYGISIQSCICMVGITGYESPNYGTAYTSPQYGYALFPEYNYRNASNTIQTLSHKVVGVYDNWVFPTSVKYGSVHFTPIWYPDGKYTVKVVESDSWTPSGMITTTNVPQAINISGNMYDDWYVGRK